MPILNEQQRAITSEGQALFLEAGAGTGKTWVLTQRFIYLLEQHPDWPIESIVAVTFTEKAAREMRTRIRQEVEKRAQLANNIATQRDRRSELDRMQVGTLHSMCARILRENAIAARIDPLFTVVDEQQAGLLQEEAIAQTLAELADQDSPCLGLLASLQVRDLRNLMAALLAKRGTVQRLFTELPEPDELILKWQNGLVEMRRAAWESYRKNKPVLQTAIQELGQVEILDREDKLAVMVEHARAGIVYLALEEMKHVFDEWSQIKLIGGKAGNWGGSQALGVLKNNLKFLQEAGKAMAGAGCLLEVGPRDVEAATALQQWRDLWQHLEQVYSSLKDARQVLDFDDLELLADSLLYQPERDPRLQSFLDSIQHLMVDEFQDTNPIQQSIIYALAHPQQTDRLFVVGDAKQSIYRFRQAQVSIFNRTGRDIHQATGQEAIYLTHSFRSHPALVAALNDLFEHILTPIGEHYADYEAHSGALEAVRSNQAASPCAPAPVELVLLPGLDVQGEKMSADEVRLSEARWLAQRLLRLQADGYPVWDKQERCYRPFQFGDAAILFRSTTSTPLYEDVFKLAGLPYLTVGGHGYYLRPEVLDLTALLSALANPGDDLSLATALRSPLFSLSDETLYRLRWHIPDGSRATQPISYRAALQNPPPNDQVEQVAFAGEVMEELWSWVGRVDVWQLLRRALDRTGFEAVLTMSDGGREGTGRRRANVQKFLELARQRGGANLPEFMLSLEDLRSHEAREGEAVGFAPESGAAQLMSIHAAKGLEFPVVAVADLGRRKGRPGERPTILFDPAYGLACRVRDEQGDWQEPAGYAWANWMDGQMEAAEDKRLLYVACTRAADLLLLSGLPGSGDTWLNDICHTWQITINGVEDDLLDKGNYSLRILRPTDIAIEASRELNEIRGQLMAIQLRELPLLVKPIGFKK